MPIFIRCDRVLKYRVRQRCSGLIPAWTPKRVSKSREQKRSSLACNSCKSKQNSRRDAGEGGGNNYGRYRFPSRGAQGERAFAQTVRHGAKELFSTADGDWDHHLSQRDTT